jgi:hypothetical protein
MALFHWLAAWNVYFYLPYIDATNYLLQVAAREHSFDCSRFAKDFPNLKEETILECFIRRKAFLEEERRRLSAGSTGGKKKAA